VDTGRGNEAAGDSFARDWQAVRADAEIQFAPVEIPPSPEPPGWWRAALEFLGEVLEAIGRALAGLAQALGLSASALPWVLGAAGLAVVAWAGWRWLGPLLKRGRAEAEGPAEEWRPPAGASLALLEEADSLAAQGRYDEATHLLLTRSIGQIEAARPGLLAPSSTAREIAASPALPDAARAAFAIIAGRVERALFALRRLSAEDWQAARAAYSDFALAGSAA